MKDLSSNRIIGWKIVYEDVNPQGSFTCQIKWLPPVGTGYIVQYVSVDDPVHLLGNYKKPYFEAWKVKDGKIVHEEYGSDEYDDSFTNCADGLTRVSEGKNSAERIKAKGIRYSYVVFKCRVFWVEEGSVAYDAVDTWQSGKEIRISMAGMLKASYDEPSGLSEGIERLFTANFDVEETKRIKFFEVDNHIVINGSKGKEIIPNTNEEAKNKHIPIVYQTGTEVHVKAEPAGDPMPYDHYIQSLLIETISGSYQRKELTQGDKLEVVFTCLERVITAYALSNYHDIWRSENVTYIEHNTI